MPGVFCRRRCGESPQPAACHKDDAHRSLSSGRPKAGPGGRGSGEGWGEATAAYDFKSAVDCNLRNENGHICETAPLAQGSHVGFLTSPSACPFCNTARKSVALGIKRLGRALPVRAKIYTSLTQGRSP